MTDQQPPSDSTPPPSPAGSGVPGWSLPGQPPPPSAPPSPPPGPPGPPGWAPPGAGWSGAPPPRGIQARSTTLALVGVGLVVVVLVAVLLVNRNDPGSNGESGKPAEQVLLDAAQAYGTARSVHLTGSAAVKGETDVFDLRLGPQGGQGTITANGVRADLVVLGDDVYLRGREFWARFAGADAAAVIGNRWLHIRGTDPSFAAQFKLLTIDGVSGTLSDMIKQPGTLDKGGSEHVDGALAVPLRGRDGAIDVALDGRPYPVRLHFDDGDTSADLHFGDYGKPLAVPPRPSDVLDAPGPSSS